VTTKWAGKIAMKEQMPMPRRPSGGTRRRVGAMLALQNGRKGLPVARLERPPKVDQQGSTAAVNAENLSGFQSQGVLSPAVPGEEPERILRHRCVRSSFQSRGVTSGWEGAKVGSPTVLPCNQKVTSGLRRRSTIFRWKAPA